MIAAGVSFAVAGWAPACIGLGDSTVQLTPWCIALMVWSAS
jgi:hypothetical protein